MSQDQAILYNALYKQVQMAINNITSLGFDTTELINEFNSINNSVKENVKTRFVKNMAEASYVNYYTSGIKSLTILKNKLDFYDIYYKAYYACQSISSKLNSNISYEELEKIVSKMIYILKEINKSSTIDYDNESKIVEKIYEVAYNTIKYEMILSGKSTLYEYAKNSDVNIELFNEFILKDVETIDLRKSENSVVKNKLLSIKEQGIYSSYFDFELIKLIILSDKNIDLKKKIEDEIRLLADEIVTSNDILKEDLKKFSFLSKEIDDYKVDIRNNRKDLAIRLSIISVILAGYILGGFGVNKLARRSNTGEAYKKITRTYSSLTDDYTEEIEEEVSKNELNDEKIAIVYSEANNQKVRKYYKYDLTDIDFESLKDYYEYGIENLDIIPYEKGRTTTNDFKNGYVEVMEITYEDLGYTKLNKSEYAGTLLVLYTAYACVLCLVTFGISFGISFTNFIIYNTICAFKELFDNKKNKKIKVIEIKPIVDKIMVEINKNEELKAQFNRIYEENKYLLNNPEELMKKIEELDLSEFNKKVKKLKIK